MMLKITQKCSMGCKHCLNRATPNGQEMSMSTLKDVLVFISKNRIGYHLVVSGGEPTEHSDFANIIKYILHKCDECGILAVTITTNGVWLPNHIEEFHKLCDYADKHEIHLLWQVTTDERYYPTKINTHKRIYRDRHVTLCESVDVIYPQGRAVDNNILWESKCSKCFNVRAISKQIKNCTLSNICQTLAAHFKYCTPHIKVDGGIGLGESDLCPTVATIYDNDIIDKIRKFKCNGCDIVNDKLDEKYKAFL